MTQLTITDVCMRDMCLCGHIWVSGWFVRDRDRDELVLSEIFQSGGN